MKIDAVVIRDAEGERRLSLSDLPVRLGTGSDCDVRLPGPGSNAVALLDALYALTPDDLSSLSQLETLHAV